MKRFFLFLALFFCLAPLCHKTTDGFALAKLSTVFIEDSTVFDETYLSERYHYLTKGGQSYVFVSEDGKTVLKFFRSSRFNHLRIIQKLFPFFQTELAELESTLKETLLSHHIAADKLKQETGLLSIHLSPTHRLHSSLKIIDKLGIEHTIDPNCYPFIIQRRATLVKEMIHHWMQEGNIEKAQDGLKYLFALIDQRMFQEIEDKDPNLSKNFGFVGESPIQIDAGSFTSSTSASLQRIGNSKEDLQHWINKTHPELSAFFDQLYTTWKSHHETR